MKESFNISEHTPEPNTANNDTSFVEQNYCGRSMPFGARTISLLTYAKRHGGVCQDVMRHPHTLVTVHSSFGVIDAIRFPEAD